MGWALLALDGFPMTAVAEQIEPPELFEWFIEKRNKMGLQIVALGPESGGAVLRTLREGGLVGLLCDRDLVGNGVEVEFFGETTTMPAGPATVALRTGAALMAAVVYSGPGPHHTGVIAPPIDLTRSGRCASTWRGSPRRSLVNSKPASAGLLSSGTSSSPTAERRGPS